MISIDRPMVGAQAPSPPSWRARVWVTVPRIRLPMTNITPVISTHGMLLERVAFSTSSRALSKPKTASRP